MFGCTIQDMHDLVANTRNVTMLVVSLMSDAQEQIALGDLSSARMTLNRAKFIVDMYTTASKCDTWRRA